MIILETTPTPGDLKMIEDGQKTYNLQHVSNCTPEPLTLFLRTADRILIGALLGEFFWNWLYVNDLWIQVPWRGKGYGTQLLRRAEDETRARGYRGVHLKTTSFQALSFYQRRGYGIYGQLEDCPVGHQLYCLKKNIVLETLP